MMKIFYEPEVIDELLASVTFEEVLNYYSYPIKGSGKNRGSICPNCNKDYQHYKVNTHTNLSNCFVCGFSSNTIQFIMKVEGQGFIKSVQKLADIAHFELPKSSQQEKRTLSTSERIMNLAIEFYREDKSDYLEERGIDIQTIAAAKIGYAPGGRNLYDYLKEKGYSKEEILESGLVAIRAGKLMDFFYQCVIFPIVQGGIVVDIYGRHIGNAKTKHVYLKGEFMAYNIDNITGNSPVIYVESIINALSVKSLGYKNVLAVGSASKFSKKHISLLKRKGASNMYNAFDTGDLSGAGQEGAIAAGRLIEQSGMKHSVIEMPEATDINQMLCSVDGSLEFRKRVLSARSTDEFELRYKLGKVNISWIHSYLNERQQL